MTDNNLSPETLCAQALGWIDATTKALVPPIHMSTTNERDPDNEYRSGRSYIREDNPSWDQVESLLTRLEGGADTLLFSAGMAAATVPFLALKPGDHVVAPNVMYWGLRKWLLGRATEWGLAVELADMTDLKQVSALMRPGGPGSSGRSRRRTRCGRWRIWRPWRRLPWRRRAAGRGQPARRRYSPGRSPSAPIW
jgi:cystathionine gamma-synthase